MTLDLVAGSLEGPRSPSIFFLKAVLLSINHIPLIIRGWGYCKRITLQFPLGVAPTSKIIEKTEILKISSPSWEEVSDTPYHHLCPLQHKSWDDLVSPCPPVPSGKPLLPSS